MSDVGYWPVAVVPVGQVSGATTLWRAKGRLSVTVVVKARYGFVNNAVMTPILPEPVLPRAGETAPYLTQADIVLTSAHAHPRSASPAPALAVRLAVFREWAVIDKSLLVYPADDEGKRAHAVTDKIPVAVGVGARTGPPGILVNPSEASRPGTLAPLPPDDPSRLALLENMAMPTPQGGVYKIPEMFPWSYFQVAPPDQRTSFLRGDEWVVLDGMDREHARLQSRLPRARAEVYVYPPGLTSGSSFRVHMEADRLSVDVDRRECSLLWRGSFPVADEATARMLILVAGVATPERPVAWPDMPTLMANPILQAHGLVKQTEGGRKRTLPMPRRELVQEDADSMAQTRNVSANDAAALFDALAADTAPPAAAAPPVGEWVEVEAESVRSAEVAQLEMSSEGVLSVHASSESVILEVMKLVGEDELQAAITDGSGGKRRTALGLPKPASRVLKPTHVHPPTPPSGDDAPGPERAAPSLDEQSVDQLELTLSDALVKEGVSNIDHLPWRKRGDPSKA
jgi:hypothetical protein